MGRGPSYPPAFKDVARELFLRGVRSPGIARELEERFPHAERWPDERTVRGWCKAWAIDQSGPWALTSGTDAAILLPLLRALIEATGGRVSSLTNAEAEELSRIGHVAGGMPVVGMYNWARAAVAARAARESLDPLIHYLCYEPWMDRGQRYLAAADAGRIRELRSFCPEDQEWLQFGSRQQRGKATMDAVIAKAGGPASG